jgi:uncharacterized protein YqjF (DUF2071 family)
MHRDFNKAILKQTAHRPWPLPGSAWVMTQTWHDLLFAHWPVDRDVLRAAVPPEFALDLFQGTAWVGVVPFHMTNVAPRGVPSIPWVSEFPELNVRTYVRIGDRPGVYFFSLDAGSAIAVRAARTLFNLPYYAARMTVTPLATGIAYESARTDGPAAVLSGTYGPTGPPVTAADGSLEYFLTERYCLYNLDRRGRPYRLEIHHPRWQLQPAQAHLSTNTMAEASGLSLPPRPPLLHFAKRQDIVAWAPVVV